MFVIIIYVVLPCLCDFNAGIIDVDIQWVLHGGRLLPVEIFLNIFELLNYAENINDMANDVNLYAGSHDHPGNWGGGLLSEHPT